MGLAKHLRQAGHRSTGLSLAVLIRSAALGRWVWAARTRVQGGDEAHQQRRDRDAGHIQPVERDGRSLM